ncbi:MAG: hypothetical protein M1826_000490 [Phylliscum demangeonii]|nr:MAG: hypothetical protein M1826_000490 [Phylliscum demangeonii]
MRLDRQLLFWSAVASAIGVAWSLPASNGNGNELAGTDQPRGRKRPASQDEVELRGGNGKVNGIVNGNGSNGNGKGDGYLDAPITPSKKKTGGRSSRTARKLAPPPSEKEVAPSPILQAPAQILANPEPVTYETLTWAQQEWVEFCLLRLGLSITAAHFNSKEHEASCIDQARRAIPSEWDWSRQLKKLNVITIWQQRRQQQQQQQQQQQGQQAAAAAAATATTNPAENSNSNSNSIVHTIGHPSQQNGRRKSAVDGALGLGQHGRLGFFPSHAITRNLAGLARNPVWASLRRTGKAVEEWRPVAGVFE